MIRKFFAIGLVMLCAGLVFAADKGTSVKKTGYVIDNACAAKHANDPNVADAVKGHPTACALMPGCIKSGHSLFADGKLYKLDSAGDKKVVDLLNKTKSTKGLQVTVEGTLDEGTIKVKSVSEVSS